MAAYARVPREGFNDMNARDNGPPEWGPVTVGDNSGQAEEQTWQQKKQFGNRRGRNKNRRPKPRAHAPASQTKPSPSARPTQNLQPPPNNKHDHPENHHQQYDAPTLKTSEKMNDPPPAKMHDIPRSAYVPPHLRPRPGASAEPTPVAGASSSPKSKPAEPSLPPTPPGTSSPVQNAAPVENGVDDSWGLNQKPSPSKQAPKQADNNNKGAKPSTSSTPSPNNRNSRRGAKTPTPSPNKNAAPVEEPVHDPWPGWGQPEQSLTKAAPVQQPVYENWPKPDRRPRKPWPKNKDMKPLPSDGDNQYIGWDGKLHGGSDFKSDSGGDPDYDAKKLTDWEGKWMPAPDWNDRLPFADRHFAEQIELWMDRQDNSCIVDLTDFIYSNKFSSAKVNDGYVPSKHTFTHHGGKNAERDEANRKVVAEELATYQEMKQYDTEFIALEMVPRSWVPAKIEDTAPHTFWKANALRDPPTEPDFDHKDRKPYWDLYLEGHPNFFLHPWIFPEIALDPDDVGMKAPNLQLSGTELQDRITNGKKRRMKKWHEQVTRPLTPPLCLQSAPQVKPMANIFLRPVRAADAPGILEIYNDYIQETVSAPEFNPRTIDHIVDRINTVTSGKLPYIVAVTKRKPKTGRQNWVEDWIVGFASIDDFCDKGSMYRFTFELEMYVHRGWLHKGIATCLMDRLLSTVNTGYHEKGGYVWENYGEYLKGDAERRVKIINASVPHDEGEDMAWMTKFFHKFDFTKKGHLSKMGYKNGKVADMTIYQHTTTEPIDAAARPAEPW